MSPLKPMLEKELLWDSLDYGFFTSAVIGFVGGGVLAVAILAFLFVLKIGIINYS